VRGGWRRRTKEKGIGRGFTKTNKPREASGRGNKNETKKTRPTQGRANMAREGGGGGKNASVLVPPTPPPPPTVGLPRLWPWLALACWNVFRCFPSTFLPVSPRPFLLLLLLLLPPSPSPLPSPPPSSSSSSPFTPYISPSFSSFSFLSFLSSSLNSRREGEAGKKRETTGKREKWGGKGKEREREGENQRRAKEKKKTRRTWNRGEEEEEDE